MDRKRTTKKPSKCPNPLFEQWLEEWRVEAASRNSDLQYCFGKAIQSLRKYPLKLNSGKECLILKNFGTQLAIKLDRKLAEYRRIHPDDSSTSEIETSNLAQSKITNIPSLSKVTSNRNSPSVLNKKAKPRKRKENSEKKDENDVAISSPKTKKKCYIPGYKSGPYAILITMFKETENPSYKGFMLKSQIMNKAQDLCDSSFTRPDPGTYYTAWSSMSTLIKKGFIKKEGNPARFALTKEGEEIAKKLRMDLDSCRSSLAPSNFFTSTNSDQRNVSSCLTTPDRSTVPLSLLTTPERNNPNKFDISSPHKAKHLSQEENLIDLTNDVSEPIQSTSLQSSSEMTKISSTESTNSDTSFEQLIFLPGDYEVILLVDTHETMDRSKKQSTSETIQELTRSKTNFEIRHLKVGDFTWIARNKKNEELVLPYIVERKRIDDLSGSIKDGRFHEQKFRLRQCGLPNVIYLIEKYGSNEARFGLPLNTLYQAIINTQVVDNFFIKIANSHSQAMIYLSVFTNLLTNIFRDKTLISCRRIDLPSFDINAEIVSLMTFKEFSKFSMKNKNMKIQNVFIKHLLQLKGLSVEKALVIVEKYPTPRLLKQAFDSSCNPEMLLANITFGSLNRNIGPAISKSIYQLYTTSSLL